MTCTNTTKIQAKIDILDAILLAAVTAYTGALGGGVKSYELNTGGGEASQRATRHDPSLLLTDIMNAMTNIEHYEDELNRVGICNMKIRRQAGKIICP